MATLKPRRTGDGICRVFVKDEKGSIVCFFKTEIPSRLLFIAETDGGCGEPQLPTLESGIEGQDGIKGRSSSIPEKARERKEKWAHNIIIIFINLIKNEERKWCRRCIIIIEELKRNFDENKITNKILSFSQTHKTISFPSYHPPTQNVSSSPSLHPKCQLPFHSSPQNCQLPFLPVRNKTVLLFSFFSLIMRPHNDPWETSTASVVPVLRSRRLGVS